MSGTFAACALFAVGAAPVPPVPPNQAPPPRLVKPDLSLVVMEWLPGSDGVPNRTRLQLVGLRRGTILSPETVWEGEEEFLRTMFVRHQIVADRLLVTGQGGVIDLREKKVLSSERDGRVEHIDEKKVVYRIESNSRPEGLFSFEYATRTVTHLAKPPLPRPWYDRLRSASALSPDRKKAIRWGDEDELILHCEGENPKSLGKGFKMEQDPKWKSIQSIERMSFPVLWLDNDRFLTQRDHGKLVIVDLNGKVTEVTTIKGAPKQTTPALLRDRSGAIFYYLDRAHYRIDLAKKTAVKSEWQALGHGFEASWDSHEKFGYKLRHDGKDIGQFHCHPYGAKTAPGHLALTAAKGQDGFGAPLCVAVWSAATGEWTVLDYELLSLIPVAGWIK